MDLVACAYCVSRIGKFYERGNNKADAIIHDRKCSFPFRDAYIEKARTLHAIEGTRRVLVAIGQNVIQFHAASANRREREEGSLREVEGEKGVGWLVGWLVGRSVGWLVGRLGGWLVGWTVGWWDMKGRWV
ncbi:hypothetical protein V1478_008016 [Vespula squamosa]|uniref:Uncharacterized protein n=1 Tax=Vespula squamosa TaxID=30214 RepID=A0ABD2AXJ4_VESSQ